MINDENFANRPWGKWFVIAAQPGYRVKKLIVNPGGTLSKQYHTHRDEYWVVLEGEGNLFLEYHPDVQHDIKLEKGFYVKIEKTVIHKLTNTGIEPLIILETQVGEICSEEDIVRLD